VSWYAERVLPHVVNLVCSTRGVSRWRRVAVEGLHGTVVEIGFGSGLNVPFYPSAVARVYAVEPRDAAWRLAQRAIGASPIAITRVGLDGQQLPLADASLVEANSELDHNTLAHPPARSVGLRSGWL
jgi:predicted RNA methylase